MTMFRLFPSSGGKITCIFLHFQANTSRQTSPRRLPTLPREDTRIVSRYHNIPVGLSAQHSRGLILSPQQYAQLDNLNSLYAANRNPYHVSPTHADDGTPRNGLSSASSNTAMSSNQEEPTDAFTQAESPVRTSAARTPSSDVTDVREFTQLPPGTEPLTQVSSVLPLYSGAPHLPRTVKNTPQYATTLASFKGSPSPEVSQAASKTLPLTTSSRESGPARSPSRSRG